MMSGLSICFVSRQYPSETGWGGIGFYVHEMAHKLVEEGHKVTVLARAVEHETVRDDEGVVVYRILPRSGISRMRILWRLNRVWEGYRWAVALKLQEIVHSHHVDLIEAPEAGAETFFYHLLNPIRHPPVIVRLHSGVRLISRFKENPQPRHKWTAARMENCVIRWADFVTAPSKAVLEQYKDLVRPGQWTVYPNPIDHHRFSPGMQGGDGEPEVLFLGRFEWHKGPQVLAQAIPLVLRERPDVRFSFAGRDWYWTGGGLLSEHVWQTIPSWARTRVSFAGELPREEVPERLQRTTVCVFPSLWENFPYAVLEAMACGKPVVASRVGGIPEQIEDGVSGLLVEPDSPQELAEAILRLLSDEALRRRLGQAARQRVEMCYAPEVVVRQAVEVYRQVIYNR